MTDCLPSEKRRYIFHTEEVMRTEWKRFSEYPTVQYLTESFGCVTSSRRVNEEIFKSINSLTLRLAVQEGGNPLVCGACSSPVKTRRVLWFSMIFSSTDGTFDMLSWPLCFFSQHNCDISILPSGLKTEGGSAGVYGRVHWRTDSCLSVCDSNVAMSIKWWLKTFLRKQRSLTKCKTWQRIK